MPIVPDRSGTLPIVNITDVNFTQRQDTERPETPPLSVLDLAETDPGLAYEASKLADILRSDPTAGLPTDLRTALTGGSLQNIFDGANNLFKTGNELYKEYNKPISDLVNVGKTATGLVKGVIGDAKSIYGVISDVAKPISSILGKDVSKDVNPAKMANTYVGSSLEAKSGMRYLLTGNEGTLTDEQLKAINLVIERELADKVAEIITGFPTSEMADKLTKVLETENISCSVLMDAVLANYKVASNKEKALAGILATTNAINPNNIINDVTKSVRDIAKNGVDFKKLKELSKLIGATGGLGNITKNVINSYKNVIGTSEMHKLADGFKTVSKGVTDISTKTAGIQSIIGGVLDSKFGGISSMLDGMSANLGGLAAVTTDSTGLVNGALSGISSVTDTLRGVMGSVTDPSVLATINGAITDATSMVATAADATSAIVNTASKVATVVAPAVGALTSITSMLPSTTPPTNPTSPLKPQVISNGKCITTCGESIIGTEINKTISSVIKASATSNDCITEANNSAQITSGLSGTTPVVNATPGVTTTTTSAPTNTVPASASPYNDIARNWQEALVNQGINLERAYLTEVVYNYTLQIQFLNGSISADTFFGLPVLSDGNANPFYGTTPYLVGRDVGTYFGVTHPSVFLQTMLDTGGAYTDTWQNVLAMAGIKPSVYDITTTNETAIGIINNTSYQTALLHGGLTVYGSFGYPITASGYINQNYRDDLFTISAVEPTTTTISPQYGNTDEEIPVETYSATEVAYTGAEDSTTSTADKSWQVILVEAGINLDAISSTEVLTGYILSVQLIEYNITPEQIYGPAIVTYNNEEYLNPYYGETPHLTGKNPSEVYPAATNADILENYATHIRNGYILYSNWEAAITVAGGTSEAVTALKDTITEQQKTQLGNNTLSVLNLLGPLYTSVGPNYKYSVKLPTVKKNGTTSTTINVTSTAPTSTTAAISGVATALAEGVVKVTGPNNSILNKPTSKKCTRDNLIALYCGGVVISGTALVSEVVKNATGIVNSVEQDVSDSGVTSAEDTTYADVDEEDPDTIYPDEVIRAGMDGTPVTTNTTNPILGVVTSTENPGSAILGTIDANVDVNTAIDTADKLQPGWNDASGTPDYSYVNITDGEVLTNTAADNYVDSSTITGAPVTATTTDLVLSTANIVPDIASKLPPGVTNIVVSDDGTQVSYVNVRGETNTIPIFKDGTPRVIDEATKEDYERPNMYTLIPQGSTNAVLVTGGYTDYILYTDPQGIVRKKYLNSDGTIATQTVFD